MNAKDFLDALEARQGRPLTASEQRKAARMFAAYEAQFDVWQPTQDAPYPLAGLNLDAMALEDLEATTQALDVLHSYAVNKVEAMRARLAGDLNKAKRAETTCQLYYENLPQNWKF